MKYILETLDKMKRIFGRKTLAFIIVMLFFGVCILQNISGNKTSNEKHNQQQIGIESAIKVANTKLLLLGKSDFSIISSNEITNTQGSTLFYTFNLQPQGYIVVSANYNLPPVIAYSFTSNFGNIDADNILLQILRADIKIRLENIQILPEDIIEQRFLLWETFLNEETQDPVNLDFRQWPAEGATLTGGWLETSWHQNEPYNNFCPIDQASGHKSVAGCPAVAMAQILNFHQTTNNVAFNDSDDYYHSYAGNNFWIDNDHVEYDFPSFPELNSYIDTLNLHYEDQIPLTDDDVAAVVFACGVAAEQVYHPEGSGTFGVSQAFQAYDRFGFEDIELLTEDDADLYERLISNIIDALPAHIAVVNEAWTVGHNMVVDGYNTDDFYHINFGWGGSYDGWYLIPSELPYELTVIEGIIVDIIDHNEDSNLQGNGVLGWVDVEPGSTVTGSFTIENVGDPGSMIDWEVIVWPDWGDWTFTPASGEGLTPEDGPLTVQVSVVAPDERNEEFSGHVKIVNIDDSSDSCLIHVSLVTPKNNAISTSFMEFLEQHPHLFPILRRLLGS